MLILYKKVFLGITNENLKAKVNDLSIFELIVYVKLTFLILLIGIKPDIILDYTTSSLDRITKLYQFQYFEVKLYILPEIFISLSTLILLLLASFTKKIIKKIWHIFLY